MGEIKPELLMELDIVTLNAHKILNLLMEKLTLLDGTHHHLTQMPEQVNGVLAALKWISGKPTLSQKLSPYIHVPLTDQKNALMQLNVVLDLETDTLVSVIKMVVILTHSEQVLLTSMGQVG